MLLLVLPSPRRITPPSPSLSSAPPACSTCSTAASCPATQIEALSLFVPEDDGSGEGQPLLDDSDDSIKEEFWERLENDITSFMFYVVQVDSEE